MMTGCAFRPDRKSSTIWKVSEVVMIVPKPVTAQMLRVMGTESLADVERSSFTDPLAVNGFQNRTRVRIFIISRQGMIFSFAKLNNTNRTRIGSKEIQKLGHSMSGEIWGSRG